MKLLKFIPTRTILFLSLVFLLWSNLTVNVSDSATPVGLYRVDQIDKVSLGDLV